MMERKEELRMEIETVRRNLELLEEELWKINTLDWCKTFLKENLDIKNSS